MVAASRGGRRRRTSRIDRAMDGAIATYLHELTEHGRPREDAADAVLGGAPTPLPAPSATPAVAPLSGQRLDPV